MPRYALAKAAERNYSNVHSGVARLEELGLVERKTLPASGQAQAAGADLNSGLSIPLFSTPAKRYPIHQDGSPVGIKREHGRPIFGSKPWLSPQL